MRIGYARVSSKDSSQDTASQIYALKASGIDALFQEKASGVKRDRPELARAIAACKPGDTLVFLQLSRIGRSTIHLLQIAEDLKARGIGMHSLKEGIDTSTAGGKAFYGMLAVFAEFERSCTMERVAAGIANARANGTRSGKAFGQPSKMTPNRILMARRELLQPGATYDKVARGMGISRSLLYAKVPPSSLACV